WIHVDIMDGRFVPNLTFGPSLVGSIRSAFPKLFLDVHIMAAPAENFVDMFVEAGTDLLTVQVEATRHIHRVIQKIRLAGARPGITLNPGTPVSMIEPVLPFVDLALVMTVNPGFGAQKLIPETLSKLKELVRFRAVHSLEYLIEVDGGVCAENASFLVLSGCDVLVAGSAVFGGKSPAAAAGELIENAAKRS
ncbi:MAG: ribulose-phosphate 3-epimerase, partial [Synergistaceae bacterium]|nr:ribulose-phosphate 3-epimerase [Synergistaceae bacterium]